MSLQYPTTKDGLATPYSPMTSTPPAYPNGTQNGVDYMRHDPNYTHIPPGQAHHSPAAPRPPAIQTNVGPYSVMSPVSAQPGYHTQPHNTPQSANGMSFVPSQNFPAFQLPPSDFAANSHPSPASVAPQHRDEQQQTSYASQQSTTEFGDQQPQQQASDMMLLDQIGMQQTMPVFQVDGIINKSPYVAMPDDFMAFLFSQGGESPMTGMPMQGYNNYGDFGNYGMGYYNDSNQLGYYPQPAGPQQVMSVTNLLDQNLPEMVISEDKALEVYELIKERFHDNGRTPVERQRESILEGDRNDDNHPLSRKMMQQYIAAYWLHFSDQVPILHKPTFSPDKTPNLLLIAIMTIGAACLDKVQGQKGAKAGTPLANFLAWHLRWEMFQDPNCRPPAKLWVFQTLLLLELYEKMYSTRELHERAHIHHATTITLMRRGRALIGKSALDSPPNPRDAQNGSRQGSAAGATTPEEWWNHWIMNEATRRAAFAAFVIDSIHATMFGHSTVMVAHEMRLPLPCDDKLWKATSSAEVARIESNLMSMGCKPISFLEGLKRTLSNQEVQTNAFGRMILMAGLLSVSWHMNQRDLQVNSLGGGVSQALGGRDKWRGTLTRAFDSWKSDFDKALMKQRSELSADPYNYDLQSRNEANVVFESRIVLHHLAHMAMHVDIVDCQIFARAKRLLGRTIGPQDLNSAQRRMKDAWAPTAKARDATYYALKFLQSVLCPEQSDTPGVSYRTDGELYSASSDVLLNRPWVLYFAALVVWCYGYALEGASPGIPLPTTQQEKVQGMREYLAKYGSVQSPEELKNMQGISHNTPLLMVLKDTFDATRWELLHEGATLLNNCIQLNMGQPVA